MKHRSTYRSTNFRYKGKRRRNAPVNGRIVAGLASVPVVGAIVGAVLVAGA